MVLTRSLSPEIEMTLTFPHTGPRVVSSYGEFLLSTDTEVRVIDHLLMIRRKGRITQDLDQMPVF